MRWLWAMLLVGACKGASEIETASPEPTDSPTSAPDPEFIALNAAPCALDVDGALHCWGNEDLGFPALDRGPYIDLAAYDGNVVVALLRPDGSRFLYNCNVSVDCSWRPDPLVELPHFGAGRAVDGTIQTFNGSGGSGWAWTFESDVDWRLMNSEGDPAALSADGILRRTISRPYPGDDDGSEPPRIYEVPDHEDVVEIAAYGRYSICVRYGTGEIRCFVDGDDEAYAFDSPPYSHLAGTFMGVCAVQSETSTIECSDGEPDRNLGPVRAISVGFVYFGRIPVCVITTDNAIRCDATYGHYDAILDDLPKGNEASGAP